MADELFPVCSPALLKGNKPLKCPEDLRDHVLLHTSNANSDDWRLWLTVAGLPADFSKQPGVTFDMIFMTVQAAIDGLGVAMGRTAYVQEDIAKGRLVVPFKHRISGRRRLLSGLARGQRPIRPNSRRSGSGCSPPCRASPDIADIPRGECACDIVAYGRADRQRSAHETRDAAAAAG